MQFKFTQLRTLLYAVALDLPVSNTEIVHEFQNQLWVADDAGYGQTGLKTRYRLKTPQGNLLNNLIDAIEHANFKQLLIHTLYSNPTFSRCWGVNPETMDKITNLYTLYTWDRPGYEIGIHTDDRMHVAQGMIYFIDGDDPDQSTTFYTDTNGSNPLRIPTGHGQGFIGANTNNSWHSGKNSSTKERYSIMIGLRLNF